MKVERCISDEGGIPAADKAFINLKDALGLGPVGMVKFMQPYDMGYGNYTKEKQEQPDISLDEIDMLLQK